MSPSDRGTDQGLHYAFETPDPARGPLETEGGQDRKPALPSHCVYCDPVSGATETKDAKAITKDAFLFGSQP